jgi:hypothetical protein
MNLSKVMSFTLINLDVTLLEVELGINYVLIISTNAGLWGIILEIRCSLLH